jgi:hypothetical protein
MKKVTAVEWLVEQIFFSDQKEKFEKYINQALEMEKQQIIDAYIKGWFQCDEGKLMKSGQYYQERFKSK